MTLSHPQTLFISRVVGQPSVFSATQISLEQLVNSAITEVKKSNCFIDAKIPPINFTI